MHESLKLETVAEGTEWWVFKMRSRLNRKYRHSLTHAKERNTLQNVDTPQTTTPGFVNRNRQMVLRPTAFLGTDHNQRVYVLSCGHCGNQYGANGTDIFQRRCPACQGGAAGCPID